MSKSELDHDWTSTRTRIRGRLTLGSTSRKADDPEAANDDRADAQPAA